MNIVQAIRDANKDHEHHPAIMDGERACTYGDLLDWAEDLRVQLQQLGIGPGDRIGFHCGDGLDYVAGALAILNTGAAIIPLATSLTPAEAGQTIERMDATGVVAQIASAIAHIPELEEQARIGTSTGGSEFVWRRRRTNQPSPYPVESFAPAFIRFSSGTTGSSKGIALSHESILQRTEAADQGLRINREDRILWVLSMSHHFVVSILLFLRKGATIIIAHRDFPASIIDVARSEGVTFIYAAPFHYHLLASDQAIRPEHLQRVRLAVSTAMKLPRETAEAFCRKFGFAPAEAYGIIEVGLPFINLSKHQSADPGVGELLPAYELHLRNQDENGIGEVCLRGPGMFDAYFSPWQWRRECLQDGWFNTGDLGRLDEQGRLILVGRTKTVIVCSGMKVFPDEVEEVLNSHPQVRESLVYGVEQGAYGQIPHAAIVPAGPLDEPQELWRALRRHCYARLSSYKVPKQFAIAKSLPKTASGKLVRTGPPGTLEINSQETTGDNFRLSAS